MSFVKEDSAAFAPATIGNVSIGFDILGMAISGVGDCVRLKKRTDSRVVIQSINGVFRDLPRTAEENTAGAALLALQEGEKLRYGFDIAIKKGIALGSGMGGSAASAVAAVVAACAMLKKKPSFEQKFQYALQGEKIASGAAHPDNVAPCLRGGLTLASLRFRQKVHSLPFPKELAWFLVHPDIKVETKTARKILAKQISLENHVQQSANLALFIAGLYKKDLVMVAEGFQDLLIEPQRAHFIPGFGDLKKKLQEQKGLLGFSISGSGPSVFGLASTRRKSLNFAKCIHGEFMKLGIPSQFYFGQGAAPGAKVISPREVSFE